MSGIKSKDNIINFKHEIFNKLIVTSDRMEICEKVSEFIKKVTGYRPNCLDILEINEDNYLCPILYIFKAIVYLHCHSFKYNENIYFYLNKAKIQQTKLKEDFNIELQNWENNWINIIENILRRDTQIVKEIYLKNANENPNDLLSLGMGMVFALYSGNKELMKDLADLHYKYRENHKDGNFIGIYSFIKQELREFEVGEEWVIKGSLIAPDNIWIQHVYSHIMYQTNRVYESIDYLEQRKQNWKKNANVFTYKHITWHLAIAYLEQEMYEKSNEIMEVILINKFEDAECGLALMGYLLRFYIRNLGILYELHYKWCHIMLDYLKNEDIYTKHLLFDCLAVWLLSYLSNQGDKNAQQILNKVMKKIVENVFSKELELDTRKTFYRTSYLNILEAMISFGYSKYEETVSFLIKERENIFKIGASDEQVFVIFDALLYSTLKSKDTENFNLILNDVYGEELINLKYIQKFKLLMDY